MKIDHIPKVLKQASIVLALVLFVSGSALLSGCTSSTVFSQEQPGVSVQSFDRSLLAGTWVENVNTKLACSVDNLHYRFELDSEGKTLEFLLDRKWRIASGEVVDRYSATVVSNTDRTLIIRYNVDAGVAPTGYPSEWEMAFVAPGIYRWHATNWPEGKVNVVVGIRCGK